MHPPVFKLSPCRLGVWILSGALLPLAFPSVACPQTHHPRAPQAAAVATTVPNAAPSLSVPIFPLSQVHAGLHGVAYTVFEGTKPEPVDLEVLGILQDAIGPGKSMILVQLTGPRAETTGVAAGMSGSPVYIDGKLVGAIGFRIGQFTKQPIAGVTPIQQMLHVLSSSDSKIRNSSSATLADASSGNRASVASIRSMGGALQPIATELAFNGFSPEAIDLFQRHLPSLGMVPVSGLGGTSPETPDAAPVIPGSAISAIIVAGDYNMAATCTVTYVDAQHLLACGHPVTHFGDISLPMTKAVVVTTVASSLDPMKIVNTTQTVGSFTEDRQSGILGVFGRQAHMIPVTVAFRDASHPHTYHFSVAEHPRLTSAALLATVYQAMQDTNGYDDPAIYALKGSISVAGYPPVEIDDWISPVGGQPSSLGTALAIGQRFDSIFSNPREVPVIKDVSLSIASLPQQDSAELADAQVLTPNVHPGDRITIQAILHPYRQTSRTVQMTARLPVTLSAGPVRLLVSDGNTLDHTLHLIPNPAAPPLGLGETIAQLNRLHPTNRLYATLLSPVPQAILQGRSLPAVPLTMANVLQPGESTQGLTLDGETAVPLVSQQLDVALTGSRVITLNVLP